MKQAFSSSNLKRYLFGFMAVFIALFSIYSMSPAAYADGDPGAIHQYRNDTSEYKECSLTSSAGGKTGPVIVIDPGHSGEDKTIVDPDTGLHDHDYENPNENAEMFYVSLLVKAQLQKDGYKVILTKGDNIKTDVKSVNDPEVNKGGQLYASFRTRAEVANSANADIAVSLHDDHGQSWESFAKIFVQRTDGYRAPYDNPSKKVTFASLHKDAKAIADKSQDYGAKFATSRSAAEGRAAEVVVNSFDHREKDHVDPGNLAMVQMFSNVPWVYNEIGAAPKGKFVSDTNLKKYAQGVIKGIEASVPSTGNEDGTQGSATTSGDIKSTNVVMQKVDLNGFKPDPKAVKYFNGTSLDLMKKYIPWYVEAAQLEGVPQNWEILPALHGPELGFHNFFKPNGIVGGASGPSGPYQETASELKSYLSDPDYGPVLKTLINSDGTAKTVKDLNKSQFVVLSRLAFHRWVAQALGKDYDKLKKGPIPYEDASSSSFLVRVMARWNSGDAVEGYNGFDTGAHKYNPGASVWPGMATTYYLLKQWEANGGMATITVAGATGADCSGTGNNTAGSVDCTAATGRAKILCEAQRYEGVYYTWSGGHGVTYENFKKKCPDPTNPPNNQKYGGTAAEHNGNPSPCGVDCSGLVHMAVAAAFGHEEDFTVAGIISSKNWKKVSLGDIQPGDVATVTTEHVEIVQSYTKGSSKITTFGAHSTGKATNAWVNSPTGNWTGYYRYTGPGV
ncbi:MAG TPA: N-acetylmuramoyl-L-alanine amidase [Patescibacteria group bacterium]|nr:N-acetylmuramoyl-L-alanine amidase [Patescibacteria group bacterium]